MASRQTKFTSYTGLYVAIFVAALVVINVLADRNNKSWDTTANKRYSLSDQTEKVVKGLKSDLQAKYFDRTSRFVAIRSNRRTPPSRHHAARFAETPIATPISRYVIPCARHASAPLCRTVSRLASG